MAIGALFVGAVIGICCMVIVVSLGATPLAALAAYSLAGTGGALLMVFFAETRTSLRFSHAKDA